MLNAIEIAALRWFAAATFPTADDRAPAPAVVANLVARGLLARRMGGFEPTPAGELEIQIAAAVESKLVPGRDTVLAYSALSGLALRRLLAGDRQGHDVVLARRNSLMAERMA